MTALREDGFHVQPEHIHDITHIGKLDVCLDCGEILGERWEPQSMDDVEAILGWQHREQMEINALDARIRNLEQMKKRHLARKNWLGIKWLPAIRNIVGAHLTETKSRAKSVLLEYGTLGTRRTRGSIEVVNQDAAIAWAELHVPDAVQVSKSILKTPLKGYEHALPGEAFRVHPPEDTFFMEPS